MSQFNCPDHGIIYGADYCNMCSQEPSQLTLLAQILEDRALALNRCGYESVTKGDIARYFEEIAKALRQVNEGTS